LFQRRHKSLCLFVLSGKFDDPERSSLSRLFTQFYSDCFGQLKSILRSFLIFIQFTQNNELEPIIAASEDLKATLRSESLYSPSEKATSNKVHSNNRSYRFSLHVTVELFRRKHPRRRLLISTGTKYHEIEIKMFYSR
jgi:hypothetical protein